MKKVNESRFYISPPLKHYLSKYKSKNNIVKEILDHDGKESGKDITLIDLVDNNFTYTTIKSIDRKYHDKLFKLDKNKDNIINLNKYFYNSEIDKIFNSNRQIVRIGKLINILFPGKFTNSEIEKFVDIVRNKNVDKFEFKIVSGNDILKYYKSDVLIDSENEYNHTIGTLASSCMLDKEQGYKGIFDLYTKNPDTCKMVIMLNKGELVARALLWDVNCEDDETGEKFSAKFMDRVYYQYSWMIKSMVEYAESNGWLKKVYDINCSNDEDKYVYRNGKQTRLSMSVNIKKIFYRRFPYLDTFSTFNVKDGILVNYDIDKTLKLKDIYGSSIGTKMNKFQNFIRKFK